MKTNQHNVVHAQRIAWELSFLGFHREDENVPCATGTVSCVSHFSASMAGWAMALTGHETPLRRAMASRRWAGAPTSGRTPLLRQGTHVLSHSREKQRVQRMRPERAWLSRSAPLKGSWTGSTGGCHQHQVYTTCLGKPTPQVSPSW